MHDSHAAVSLHFARVIAAVVRSSLERSKGSWPSGPFFHMRRILKKAYHYASIQSATVHSP